MPLEIPNQPALLPLGTAPNLVTLLSPAENIVHGYNMAEQTCFHKTTVSNVIPVFNGLLTSVRGIDALTGAAGTLVAQITAAVSAARTLLTAASTVVGAVTTVIATVTGLVVTVITTLTTIIGAVTSIIASLGGIATACLVAGIATIAAGVLFGFGFVGLGGLALTVLLAIFFFVVRGAVMGIMTLLTTITGALAPLSTAIGTLTAPLTTLAGGLAPLNAAIGTLNGILSNAALPPDVTRALADVSAELTNVHNALVATAQTLDQRTKALDAFLKPTPAGGVKVPRTHLEDTYRDAIAIYNTGVTATQGNAAVWAAFQMGTNGPQLTPNGGAVDTMLKCAEVPQG